MTIKETREALSPIYHELPFPSIRERELRPSRKSSFDFTTVKRDEPKKTIFFRVIKNFFQSTVPGFTKKEEKPLFKEKEAYEKLLVKRPDPLTTFTPLPSLWPASERGLSFEWPYLIMERNQETLIEAPFNEKLTKLKPMKGRLMMSSSGHLYLKIPETVVSLALSFIKPETRNLSNLPSTSLFGANVGVMLPHELERASSNASIEEIDEEFYFSIRGCYMASMKEWSEVWFLTVDCPALEVLRRKYGLSPTLSLSAFSSVVAVSSDIGELDILSTFDGYFRISPVSQPA